MLTLFAAAAATVTSPALEPPLRDPVSIVDDLAAERGSRTEVLVLGTSHLSGLPKDVDRALFDPLMNRLADWRPEAIAIEQLSGAQCDHIAARAFAFPGTFDNYCFDAAPARTAIGLDGAQAEAEAEGLLAVPATDRPPAARRRLAALFLAMGEPHSAGVQWLRLTTEERRAGDGLTGELVAILEKRASRLNESDLIAVRLAARLGHERVWPVDDHTGDRASGPTDDEVFGREISAIWDNPTNARLLPIFKDAQAKVASGEMPVLEWYRMMNSDAIARETMRGDFGAAAGAKVPGNSGRKYLAYWETRNLRMVANIREVTGAGRKTLAIVGASHVPYYNRYLGMTSDLVLADPQAVLAD